MNSRKAGNDNLEENEKLKEQLQRALADYDNLKKRSDKEKHAVVKYANESLLLNLVGVVEGLEITLNQFRGILAQAGFKEIRVDKGDKFNGELMEAVDGEGEMVESVISTGYKLHEKVAKPARVRVTKD